MESITFDITTVTLGELAAAERQSGQSFQELMKGSMSRTMLALFIHELRHSDKPRSWSELSNLTLLDASSLISPSSPDGVPTSSDG